MNPPFTDSQKAEFKEQFRRRKRRQLILLVPIVGVMLLSFWLRGHLGPAGQANGLVAGMPPAMPGIFVFAVVIGALVFSFRNWRCPACDRYLGKGSAPRFCPKCGVELQ
ncbi:MAG: hypothetical protein ABI639_14755 [Thermoanaerobaculia bacterium]